MTDPTPLCTCDHTRDRHEDAALAPECLDCPCDRYRPVQALGYAHGVVPPPPPALVSAGGWCAPSDAVYDATLLNTNEVTVIGFPDITTPRGAITWHDPTPAERAATEAMRARNTRAAEHAAALRAAAIDTACVTALREGWDVHVYEPREPYQTISRWTTHDLTRLTHVGIEYTPAAHPIPTIHHHQPYDPDWDDD